MSGGTTPRESRTPLAIRIRVKTADEDSFRARYGANISRNGIFIRTKSPPAVGEELKFSYELEGGNAVFSGIGIVRWRRGPEVASSEQPAGIGVEFLRLDEKASAWLDALIERYGDGDRALGWGDPSGHRELLAAYLRDEEIAPPESAAPEPSIAEKPSDDAAGDQELRAPEPQDDFFPDAVDEAGPIDDEVAGDSDPVSPKVVLHLGREDEWALRVETSVRRAAAAIPRSDFGRWPLPSLNTLAFEKRPDVLLSFYAERSKTPLSFRGNSWQWVAKGRPVALSSLRSALLKRLLSDANAGGAAPEFLELVVPTRLSEDAVADLRAELGRIGATVRSTIPQAKTVLGKSRHAVVAEVHAVYTYVSLWSHGTMETGQTVPFGLYDIFEMQQRGPSGDLRGATEASDFVAWCEQPSIENLLISGAQRQFGVRLAAACQSLVASIEWPEAERADRLLWIDGHLPVGLDVVLGEYLDKPWTYTPPPFE